MRARRAKIGPAWSARRVVQGPEFAPLAPEAPLHPVRPVCDKLSALLGRPLRIHCVGTTWEAAASQLAARGAIVHRELSLDCAITKLPGDCDVALVDSDGALAPATLAVLAAGVETIVIAARRASSAGEARPAIWVALRDAYAFVQEVVPTTEPGPDTQLWFASNRYWLLSDEIGAFDQFKSEPHAAARGTHEGTRRYYFGGGRLVKHYVLDNARRREVNLKELRGEIRFLRSPPPGFPAPALIATGERPDEGWLIRDDLEGRLLLELMRDGARFDAHTVLHDVLTQLSVLEAAGLYHNDVRPWNVVIAPDGRANLIDYGAISRDPSDCGIPSNPFIAFLVFACEVFGGTSSRLHGVCLPRFDPDHVPPPYRAAFWSMLQSPPSQWRFARLLDDIRHPRIVESSDNVGLHAVLRAADECTITLDGRLTESAAEIADLRGKMRAANEHESSLTAGLASAATALETKMAEIDALRAEVYGASGREASLASELAVTTETLERKVAEIDALRAAVHDMSTREASLATSLAMATEALERNAASIGELRAEVENIGMREASLAAVVSARTFELETSRAEAARRAASEALIHQQLAAYHGSTSWRITAPLRMLRRFANRIVGSQAAHRRGD